MTSNTERETSKHGASKHDASEGESSAQGKPAAAETPDDTKPRPANDEAGQVKIPKGELKLTKRFYQTVTFEKTEATGARDIGFAIVLDGRPIKTPGRKTLHVPNEKIAEMVCAEWDAQSEVIDPRTMPVTRVVNTARDGIEGKEEEVRAEIAKFIASDALCYRVGFPDTLVQRQTACWDPILAWLKQTHGIELQTTTSILPIAQDEAVFGKTLQLLAGYDALVLAALHVMTTLTGSAALALAVLGGHVTVRDAWAAAHLEEDHQIAAWGEDEEAKIRHQKRWQEMEAAGRVLVSAHA